MEEIEILIKSFLRPNAVLACIDSIRKFYPKITISVCDDGVLTQVDKANNAYTLPYYSGHSVGRNYLLSLCRKPYFFMCDDDMLFTKETDLEKLLKVAKGQNNIGIVGLKVDDVKLGIKAGPGHLKVTYGPEGRIIRRIFYGPKAPVHVIAGVQAIPCRIVPHSFLGNTHLFREWGVKWRDELKRCSHLPFFLDFPKKLKIYCVPEVTISHYHESNEDFDRYKNDDIYKRMTCERKIVYERQYE